MAPDRPPKAPKRTKSPGSDSSNPSPKKARQTGTHNPFYDRGPDRNFRRVSKQDDREGFSRSGDRHGNPKVAISRENTDQIQRVSSPTHHNTNNNKSQNTRAENMTMPLRGASPSALNKPQDTSYSGTLPPNAYSQSPAVSSGRPSASSRAVSCDRISQSPRLQPANQAPTAPMGTFRAPPQTPGTPSCIAGSAASTTLEFLNSHDSLLSENTRMTQQRDSLQLRYQAALQDEEQNRPFFENFPALKKSKTLARGKIEQALNEVNGELDQLRAKLEEHNRQYASVLDQNTARVGAEEKNQIIAQRKQITTLESQLHHCDDDLRSKAKTLKSQTAWLQDIQSRQNEAEDKITKLHMGLENDSGSHQLPRINKIDANAKTVSKELQNLRGIVEKLRDDSLDFKDFQRGFHGTDFEKTYDRARDATKDIDFLNRDVTQLKNDLQRFREARTRNNDELETLRNDVKKLQKAASMPQEDEKQRTSGIKQIEDINKSVREHTSQIENLSRRLSKAEPRDTGVDVRDDVKGLEDKLAAVEQIIAAMPKTSDEHATEIDKSNSLSDFVTVQHLQGVTEELKKELDSGVEGRLRDLEQKFKQSTSDYVTKQESKTLDERLRKAEQCLVHIYAQHSNSPPANGGASDSARSHTTGTPPGLQEAQASIYQAHQHIGILTNRLNQYDRRLEDNTRSIEPLRVTIQHLETRHQNLTTETLSKLLINETSRMFPDARYLQQTANRCHAQWQTTKELSETVSSLRQTVEVGNANGMGKNYTLTLKSHETRLVELTKAHDDVLQRVERDHEELVRKMNGLEDAPGLIAGHTESLASVKSELEECRALVQKAQLDTRTVEGRFGAHVERMVKITSAIELLNRKNDLPAFEELL